MENGEKMNALFFVVAGRRKQMALSEETDVVLRKIAKARNMSLEDVAAEIPVAKILKEKGSLNDDTIRGYLEETFSRIGGE